MQSVYSSILLVLPIAPSIEVVTAYLHQQHPQINFSNYPDLLYYNQAAESLKIATVRQIIRDSHFAPYNKQQRFCILLHADHASIPAQNALLKLIEEPPNQTQIILAVQQIQKLLPTIQSRCQLIKYSGYKNQKLSDTVDTQDDIEISDFEKKLNSYSSAIDFAENYKDRQRALNLLQNLIKKYQEKLPVNQSNVTIIKLLLESYNQLEQNVNVKLVLENCFFKIKHSTAH